MNLKTFDPNPSQSLFVKSILVFEENDKNAKTILPFFADGYPGLIFQQTNGLIVRPHNKLMPQLFLYGQTIKPIEMVMHGQYKLIIFQLYPFVLKSFFHVDPQVLKDNCYDLQQMDKETGKIFLKKLNSNFVLKKRIDLLSALIQLLFENKKNELDQPIVRSIQKIITKKGQLSIGDLASEVNITERTFERRFLSSVGVTAKQFAKVIQFHNSLQELTLKDHSKLSDIVYRNGFSDQSHFIKVFKAYTGKTPLAFKSGN